MTLIKLLLHRHKRIIKDRYKALKQCPQKKGTCIRVAKITPKKPNSANRPYARVILTTYQRVNCHIPGETHNLKKYNLVLVRGGRVPDMPGVKFRIIHTSRRPYELKGLYRRKSSRSKYGTKNFNRLKLI